MASRPSLEIRKCQSIWTISSPGDRTGDSLRCTRNGHGRKTTPYFWACLAHLSAGPAETMIVGLEDLWLESDPHIPGPSGGDPGCDAT